LCYGDLLFQIPALSHLGERVSRDAVFSSRRGTGLRPPARRQKAALGLRAKGHGRSGPTRGYGPEAGEGVAARASFGLAFVI
jgi:hypothetical protein